MKEIKAKILIILIILAFITSTANSAESKSLLLTLPGDYFKFGFSLTTSHTKAQSSISLEPSTIQVDEEGLKYYVSKDFYVYWEIAARTKVRLTLSVSDMANTADSGNVLSFVPLSNGSTVPISKGEVTVKDYLAGDISEGYKAYSATVSLEGAKREQSYSALLTLKVESV